MAHPGSSIARISVYDVESIILELSGANKPNFRRSIRYMLKKHNTDILALFETHVGGAKAGKICQGLGFDNSFRVDEVGQSGGLLLLWRSTIGTVTVIESSNQFIYARWEKDPIFCIWLSCMRLKV